MSKMTECGRRMKWRGGEHDFDLGAERAIAILSGDPMAAMPTAFLARMNVGRLGKSRLDGQFGDTPAACLKRFEQGVYSIEDVQCIIEISLYGGGLSASEAIDLVEKHVRGKPLAENATLAYEVLAALFIGAQNDASNTGT